MAAPNRFVELIRPEVAREALGLRPIEWIVYAFQKVGVVVIAALLFTIFSLTTPDFSSSANIDNILIQISVLAVVSIGETLVMLLRGIDLSVGSVVLFSAVVVSVLSVNDHVPLLLAIIIALLLSLGIGCINGVVVAVVGIEPIIVTLAMAMAVQGLDQFILAKNGSWIQVLTPFFTAIYENRVLFLPVMAVIMLALYIVAALLLRYTPFGRYVYAVGDNLRAAHLAGINVTLIIFIAYAIAGLCAGIAGLLETAQVGTISQNIASGLEFSAITAVLVGGLKLTGGVGSVEKTLIGAAIFGMIANYLTLENFSIYYKQAFAGFLILIAAILVNFGFSKE
jgi:ribose/xylose/arabinose/galactoside ABC-type transport system permease subunit